MLPSLSIIIPAFNEAGRLPRTLREVVEFGGASLEVFEVIVVDDGSSDGTADVVDSLHHHEVRVLRQPAQGGKGSAVRAGTMVAQHDWLLFLDADHAIRVDEIAALADQMESCPIVIGSKRMPSSQVNLKWKRRLMGSLGQFLIRRLAVGGFRDTQCGFKLLRRETARALLSLQRVPGFGYDFEMLYLARRYGIPVAEVPVRCVNEVGSSVHLSSYVSTLLELFRLLGHRALGSYPRTLP